MPVNTSGVPSSYVFANCHAILHRELESGGLNRYLWKHQVEALKAIYHDLIREQKRFSLCVMPTGTGKSLVGVLAPYILNTARVLVIAPSVVVAEQLRNDFIGFKDSVGRTVPPLLVRRDIWDINHAHLVTPRGPDINSSTDLTAMSVKNPDLVVVNAQKLGTNSNIELSDIPKMFDLIIVDEAHHFPADTWTSIVSYFDAAKVLLLTATPFNPKARKMTKGKVDYILDKQPPSFQFSKKEAIRKGIIRDLELIEVDTQGDSEEQGYRRVIRKTLETLHEHDMIDPTHRHQAMVLTRLTSEAKDIVNVANEEAKSSNPEDLVAALYIAGTDGQVLEDFSNAHHPRILTICGRLLEGYDNKNISVCVVLRNVAPASAVLFAQYMGRCLRRFQDIDDDVVAKMITDRPNQRTNFLAFKNERKQFLPDTFPEDFEGYNQ